MGGFLFVYWICFSVWFFCFSVWNQISSKIETKLRKSLHLGLWDWPVRGNGRLTKKGCALIPNVTMEKNVPQCLHACSVMSDFLQLCGQELARLLAPWDFLGKNAGVGWYFLLQGIFLTQNWTRVSCVSYIGRWILYYWSGCETHLNVCCCCCC